MKQTRFVDPLALAQKRRKDLVNRQTEAINSASRPIIEVLPDDYDEHEEKQEKKSKTKRQRSERDNDDDEDMKELLAIINEKPGEEEEQEEVGKQEIGMLLIEYPGEDTKKAAAGDDVDALFEEDPVSHREQLPLVSLPSRQRDGGLGTFYEGLVSGELLNGHDAGRSVASKSRDEVRLERLQALKEERERENELRRKSIRMSRPDLVDEKALHRKEAYYQHNWRPPGNTNDRQTTTVIKPLSQKQYRRLQGQARARVLPANASSSVAKKRPHKNPRPKKKKQRSSRNYRNQHWDSYGNWHDPDRDNFWKSGNNADRE